MVINVNVGKNQKDKEEGSRVMDSRSAQAVYTDPASRR